MDLMVTPNIILLLIANIFTAGTQEVITTMKTGSLSPGGLHNTTDANPLLSRQLSQRQKTKSKWWGESRLHGSAVAAAMLEHLQHHIDENKRDSKLLEHPRSPAPQNDAICGASFFISALVPVQVMPMGGTVQMGCSNTSPSCIRTSSYDCPSTGNSARMSSTGVCSWSNTRSGDRSKMRLLASSIVPTL